MGKGHDCIVLKWVALIASMDPGPPMACMGIPKDGAENG